MDAVKTGTTVRLEEVKLEDGREKGYYDVRLTGSRIISSIHSQIYSRYDASSRPSSTQIEKLSSG